MIPDDSRGRLPSVGARWTLRGMVVLVTSANDFSSVSGELEEIQEHSDLAVLKEPSEGNASGQANVPEHSPARSTGTTGQSTEATARSTENTGCGCGGACGCGGHSHNRMETPQAQKAREAGFADLSEGRPNLGLRAGR